jgi:hypothetical protein
LKLLHPKGLAALLRHGERSLVMTTMMMMMATKKEQEQEVKIEA